MKNPKMSHCSDECLLVDIKNSKSLVKKREIISKGFPNKTTSESIDKHGSKLF